MTEKNDNPIYALVDIADRAFSKAAELQESDTIASEEDLGRHLKDLRKQNLEDCISLWMAIIRFLAVSTLQHTAKKELIQDANKVMSRCYEHLGDLHSARKHIARAIDEGYLAGFVSLGAICMKLEDYEEAENAFKSAISNGVMEMRAHAGLGELYFTLGNIELKKDSSHTEYFQKAEQEFIIAGKARFTQGFDRAVELFEKVGLRDRALSVCESAVDFYEHHRQGYGEKLRFMDSRIRRIAGDEKHDRMVRELGRRIKSVLDDK